MLMVLIRYIYLLSENPKEEEIDSCVTISTPTTTSPSLRRQRRDEN